MKLHRAKIIPDWELTAESNRNVWQFIASRTFGIVTIGNVISLIGFIAVMYGLKDVIAKDYLRGVCIIGFGRLLDVLDGIAADKTHTKSPFGEIVDAGIDKIVILITLYVLVTIRLIPLWLVEIILIQNLLTIVVSFVARMRRRVIHPSKIGKISTGIYWLAIGGFIIYQYALTVQYNLLVLQSIIAATLLLSLVGLLLGIASSIGYIIVMVGFIKRAP